MGSSRTELNDDDDSATISDRPKTDSDSDSATETDEDRPASRARSSPFQEGEKVLAFHHQVIYEAKVIKIDYRLGEIRYLVHYLGWNKNWDEWLGVDRLLKYTKKNLQKQKANNEKYENEKSTKTGRTLQIKPKTSSAARGKKRKHDYLNKEKGPIPSEKLGSLQIPPTLKKQLVDDCEFITHLGKLVKLPRTPNVDDILRKYHAYWLKKDSLTADSVGEILKGLCCYFDKALPMILLYKSERQQYADAISHDVPPSKVYGAEHLLRLFVKLPEMLASANIEEVTLTEMLKKFLDFLKFLQKNQSTFFLSTYHVAEDTETSTNIQDD